MPFYYIDHLKVGAEQAASLLFVFLAAGAAGTLLGGPMADRWGAKRFTMLALFVASPMGFLFLGPAASRPTLILALFGAALVSTFTTTVVLGQAFFPRNPATASGLIVGFAIGAGGLAVTLLGRIADLYGVRAALLISAWMPLVALLVAAFLPSHRAGGDAPLGDALKVSAAAGRSLFRDTSRYSTKPRRLEDRNGTGAAVAILKRFRFNTSPYPAPPAHGPIIYDAMHGSSPPGRCHVAVGSPNAGDPSLGTRIGADVRGSAKAGDAQKKGRRHCCPRPEAVKRG